MVPIYRELVSRGIPTLFCVRDPKRNRLQADKALTEMGIPFRDGKNLLLMLRPDDVVLSCLRSRSTKRFKKLWPGNRLVHVGLNEGCRFTAPGKYEEFDYFFGFGPSAIGVGVKKVCSVGSPEIEGILEKPRQDSQPNSVVINLKGTRKILGSVDNDAWLDEALLAVESIGFKPVISVHPNHVLHQQNPAGLEIASAPVGDLLLDCPAIISRQSTLIYQALAVGCQPFHFSEGQDEEGEFADPMGAFPVCLPGQLVDAVKEWHSGTSRYEPDAFLKAHVEIDPNRSSVARIADALEEIMADGDGPQILSR